MSIKFFLQKAPFTTCLVTGFGVGFLPKMPGTWGSLLAIIFLIFYLPLLSHTPPLVFAAFSVLILFALFILGLFSIKKYMSMTKTTDPKEVILDEIVGQCMAASPTVILLGTPDFKFSLLAAFFLFRFFDIWKMWPISVFDRRKDAFGVLMDDVIAGLFAALILGFAIPLFA